jgi:excisionase family DNA binding protein
MSPSSRSGNDVVSSLPKFLTTQELCDLLRVSEKTVQRWRRGNLITYVLKGGGYLFPSSDVSRFIASRTVPIASEIPKLARRRAWTGIHLERLS